MSNPVSVDDALKALNELVRIDTRAMSDLIENRIACAQGMIDHPTAQVTMGDDGYPKIGLLGVLNAIFGADGKGFGYIAADYDQDNRLRGFVRTRPTTS